MTLTGEHVRKFFANRKKYHFKKKRGATIDSSGKKIRKSRDTSKTKKKTEKCRRPFKSHFQRGVSEDVRIIDKVPKIATAGKVVRNPCAFTIERVKTANKLRR